MQGNMLIALFLFIGVSIPAAAAGSEAAAADRSGRCSRRDDGLSQCLDQEDETSLVQVQMKMRSRPPAAKASSKPEVPAAKAAAVTDASAKAGPSASTKAAPSAPKASAPTVATSHAGTHEKHEKHGKRTAAEMRSKSVAMEAALADLTAAGLIDEAALLRDGLQKESETHGKPGNEKSKGDLASTDKRHSAAQPAPEQRAAQHKAAPLKSKAVAEEHPQRPMMSGFTLSDEADEEQPLLDESEELQPILVTDEQPLAKTADAQHREDPSVAMANKVSRKKIRDRLVSFLQILLALLIIPLVIAGALATLVREGIGREKEQMLGQDRTVFDQLCIEPKALADASSHPSSGGKAFAKEREEAWKLLEKAQDALFAESSRD